MTGDRVIQVGRMASGQLFTSPLQDVRSVSRKMVGHFAEHVAPCGTLPGEALRGDVSTVTRLCLELAVDMFDGGDPPAALARLESVAAQWAREGIPLDIIQQAVHEGFRLGADLIHARATPADFTSVRDGARRQLDVLELITVTLTRAYIQELRSVVSEHHTAAHTLTTALLSGHSDSIMARQCGMGIADRYHVVAVAIAAHPEENLPGINVDVVARRKLRRVQAALATSCGDTVLSLMSVTGGTVLIPASVVEDADLDSLIAILTAAAETGIHATTLPAPVAAIPDVAHQAHQLLDTVHSLRRPPGLYRLADVALEYQITRPGPGRDALRYLLDPLDDHPELLQTLACHLANNFNRQRTASTMHIHTNTVDYRLKRITQLTGCDPTTPNGLWYLRSALTARNYAGETS
ncbi:helix-turn-helix domain-containing protein [Nocardia wallacei]|uniref:PucR family transcriptional regulator n=1 Tax=Nocardia wallacei TaxID=480035 RepID=UPI00313BD54B